MNKINEIKNKRKYIEEKLNNQFNNLKTYEEKFDFIFNLILKTQQKFLEYKNNDFLNQEYYEILFKQLINKEKLNDQLFSEFINDYLINKIPTNHLKIKYNDEKIEFLNNLYSILLKEKDLKTKQFIEDNNFSMLINSYLADQNNDLYQFIQEKIINKIGVNTSEKLKQQQKNNVEIFQKDDTLILVIRSFAKKNLKQDVKLFKTLQIELNQKEYSNIIIDIRGNSGGTDEYFEYLSMFSNKDYIIEEKWFNLITNEIETFLNKIITKSTNKDYNKYLLVDNEVFSTAERFASFCKETNFATVVGSKTKGEGFGIDPISLKLDCCEINIPIEAPLNTMNDIDYNNYYNTIPDIKTDPKDALIVVLNYIEEKNNEKLNSKFKRN